MSQDLIESDEAMNSDWIFSPEEVEIDWDAPFPEHDRFAGVLGILDAVWGHSSVEQQMRQENMTTWFRPVGEDLCAYKMFTAGGPFLGGAAFRIPELAVAEVLCDLAQCVGRTAEVLRHVGDEGEDDMYVLLVSPDARAVKPGAEGGAQSA